MTFFHAWTLQATLINHDWLYRKLWKIYEDTSSCFTILLFFPHTSDTLTKQFILKPVKYNNFPS